MDIAAPALSQERMRTPHRPVPEVGIRATLAGCRIFDGLPDEDLSRIAAFARLVRLEKGETLFREGEPSRGFFVVQSGAVLVRRHDAQGREQVLHQLARGDSFAEASMTAPGGYPANAEALTSASVVLIPKGAFLETLKDTPELSLRIIASLSRHIRGLADRMRARTTLDAESRLAGHLLGLATEAGGPEFTLPATRRVLAANLGMAEETLSRAFARLKAEHLVETRSRRILITDAKALATRAG